MVIKNDGIDYQELKIDSKIRQKVLLDPFNRAGTEFEQGGTPLI